MKYYDIISHLEDGEPKKIRESVIGGTKAADLQMLREYYDGVQWELSRSLIGGSTRRTRSHKEMWANRDTTNPAQGFTAGELKIWNVCDSTVDVFTSYVRGSKSDQNKVMVESNDELAKEINGNLNVDNIIQRTTQRMCIDSVAVWKYCEGGTIEFIDSKEIVPIYKGDLKVGTIRLYETDKNDPMVDQSGAEKSKDKKYWYMEIWYKDQDTEQMKYYRFINDVQIDPDKDIAPFAFDPYIITINKDNEFVKFDENHTEISEVAKLVDLQDDLNAFVTDVSLINRQVSIPMLKIVDSVWEKMLSGEVNAENVKKDLGKLQIIAGKVLSAPLERMESDGLPSSMMQYLDSVYDQIHRITGIPKAIYVSDGVGNIAGTTLQNFMESLKRRVDEKRSNIEHSFKQYVVLYEMDKNGVESLTREQQHSIMEEVSVEWAEMFAMTKEQQSEQLISGLQARALPGQYVLEKLLDLWGDGERFMEVLGMSENNSLTMQTSFESAQLAQEIKRESANKTKQAEAETAKARNEAKKKQEENSLLMQELKSEAGL